MFAKALQQLRSGFSGASRHSGLSQRPQCDLGVPKPIRTGERQRDAETLRAGQAHPLGARDTGGTLMDANYPRTTRPSEADVEGK